jgi:hypothetical protein
MKDLTDLDYRRSREEAATAPRRRQFWRLLRLPTGETRNLPMSPQLEEVLSQWQPLDLRNDDVEIMIQRHVNIG